MSTLMVGIDVSQAHNDVCAINETGEVIEGHQRFDNDRLGMADLEQWLVEVLAEVQEVTHFMSDPKGRPRTFY